jgi:hypothetical protein
MTYLSIQDQDRIHKAKFRGSYQDFTPRVMWTSDDIYDIIYDKLEDGGVLVRLSYSESMNYKTKQDFLRDWDLEPRTVPAEDFTRLLDSNVDNQKLSDADFRNLVRNSLPIVIGSEYTERKRKLHDFLKDDDLD